MIMSSYHRRENARSRDIAEALSQVTDAHRAETELLKTRLLFLESELEAYKGGEMIFLQFLAKRHPELIPEFVRLAYSEDSIQTLDEHGATPKMLVAELEDDCDLSSIPETGDDFKRRRR